MQRHKLIINWLHFILQNILVNETVYIKPRSLTIGITPYHYIASKNIILHCPPHFTFFRAHISLNWWLLGHLYKHFRLIRIVYYLNSSILEFFNMDIRNKYSSLFYIYPNLFAPTHVKFVRIKTHWRGSYFQSTCCH